MIATLARISWLTLRRDVGALALTFILPIVFFSIFAFIFGAMSFGGGDGGGGTIRVIVVDHDNTQTSARFIQALDDMAALRVITRPAAGDDQPPPPPYDRDTARQRVQEGHVPAAIVIPEGFSTRFGNFIGARPDVEVIYDRANPLAQHSVAGLMQGAAMQAAPDVLMTSGLQQLERFGGGLTPQQKTAVNTIRPFLRGDRPWDELQDDQTAGPAEVQPADQDAPEESPAKPGFDGLVHVTMTPARARQDDEDDDGPAMVAYYAAGISVMFLLFSMSGASSSILEEEETGTLERLLTSNVKMGTLLASNWLFAALLGVVQVAIMFLWAAWIFHLELFTLHNLTGFAAMTLATAAAAAGFGILLATLCRSRAQLGGVSTIVILIMSALGGSMVPRFLMPDFMNSTALFTFNGWALDGYLDVFWNRDPHQTVAQLFTRIAPELAALAVMTLVFLALSRLLARRWQSA